MVFSTLVFLHLFLPCTLLGAWILSFFAYRSAKRRGGNPSWVLVNLFLFFCSLFFYFWGEGFGVCYLLLSVFLNDGIARLLATRREERSRKCLLAAAVVFNLSFLGCFKYADFFVSTVNSLISAGFPLPHIALPLGISFYTFQAMSYVIDVYRREAHPPRSVLDFGCYLTMFPQLVAGPIVRYTDVARALETRSTPIDFVASGLRRFLAGLAKKVLIANSVAPLADAVWALAESGKGMHPGMAFLGILCYALQIYYDFSGYSDMAIGLGRMFGFSFPENFLHPYCASSIREFWRRWHISLSSWFRDYLYIPLGGSRCSRFRAGVNGLIVFGLCGLWHGASWMFLLWGLWHGFFLLLERYFPRRGRAPEFPIWRNCLCFLAGHIYTIAVFLFGWILFRSEGFTAVRTLCLSLTGGIEPVAEARALWLECTPVVQLALSAGVLFAYPSVPFLQKKICSVLPRNFVLTAENLFLLLLGAFSMLALAGGTYNPFLYFRF